MRPLEWGYFENAAWLTGGGAAPRLESPWAPCLAGLPPLPQFCSHSSLPTLSGSLGSGICSGVPPSTVSVSQAPMLGALQSVGAEPIARDLSRLSDLHAARVVAERRVLHRLGLFGLLGRHGRRRLLPSAPRASSLAWSTAGRPRRSMLECGESIERWRWSPSYQR